MRFLRYTLSVSLGSFALAGIACVGAAAGDAAKSPSGAAPDPAPDGSAASGNVADAGPPTTTTVTLGDGGDLQGAKLSETHTVAAPATSAASATPPGPKGGHAHETGRNPEDIRAIIIAHRDEARACYDSGAKDHPGIEGDLVIQWTIDPKGNVTQTSLDSSRSQILEPTTVACVSDIIKKLQFAPSPGGFETKAFYPFNFHPHRGVTHAAPPSP